MTTPSFDATFLAALDDLLRWRRDVRRFRTDPLPPGIIDDLLDTACRSPSVGNAQPWRFVEVHSAQRRAELAAHVEAHRRMAGTSYDADRQKLYGTLRLHGLNEAPAVLAVFCDEADGAGHGLGRRTMPETLVWSVVAAIHTLWLAARARGVGLGWVSILDPAAINKLLDVPANWRFVALLCLGFPAEENAVPELVRHGWQERLPRSATRFTR